MFKKSLTFDGHDMALMKNLILQPENGMSFIVLIKYFLLFLFFYTKKIKRPIHILIKKIQIYPNFFNISMFFISSNKIILFERKLSLNLISNLSCMCWFGYIFRRFLVSEK